ncbi:MAG: DNA starvation/stationary phase protection protein [Opitutales bacterium]|nr:DNA starvation/stationary phase protection protein [Opitutales bacterium]
MKKELLIDSLNKLLADTHLINVKLHNYHWNIEGPQFLPVHHLTEEYYNHFFAVFDDVAERILQLGKKPIATTKGYLEVSGLSEEEGNSFTAEQVFKSLAADFDYLHQNTIALLREAEELGDVTTGNMMADLNDWLEKAIWMLRQSLV